MDLSNYLAAMKRRVAEAEARETEKRAEHEATQESVQREIEVYLAWMAIDA